MSKTIPASKFQEWKGLDRISLIVHEMKCISREITKGNRKFLRDRMAEASPRR